VRSELRRPPPRQAQLAGAQGERFAGRHVACAAPPARALKLSVAGNLAAIKIRRRGRPAWRCDRGAERRAALPNSLVSPLRRRSFFDVRLAACFTLEGVEIGQAGKPQRFANKPHRSSAGSTTRSLDGCLVRTFTQHTRLSGASICSKRRLGTEKSYEVTALPPRGQCLNSWQ
jgi:hypothetical protein